MPRRCHRCVWELALRQAELAALKQTLLPMAPQGIQASIPFNLSGCKRYTKGPPGSQGRALTHPGAVATMKRFKSCQIIATQTQDTGHRTLGTIASMSWTRTLKSVPTVIANGKTV